MPNRSIPEYWRNKVKEVLAEHDGDISVRKVFLKVKAKAQKLETDNNPAMRPLAKEYPSERTISRIKEKDWPRMSEGEHAQYRTFYWPESMERGDLSWEASAAALEILGMHSFWRPTIRQTKWFWRISMTAPDLSGVERLDLAWWFASWEAVMERPEESVRALEGYLCFAPWRSDENKQVYDEMVAHGRIPPMLERGSGILRGGEIWEPLPSLDEEREKHKSEEGTDG